MSAQFKVHVVCQVLASLNELQLLEGVSCPRLFALVLHWQVVKTIITYDRNGFRSCIITYRN